MLQYLQNTLPLKGFLKRIYIFLKILSAEIVIAVVLLLISLLLFYLLVYFVFVENRDSIDASVFLFFKPFTSPAHTNIATIITFFGTGSFLIPLYIFIVFWLVRKKLMQYAWVVSVMALSSLLLGWLLKQTFHRCRPPYPLVKGAGGYSFPSGHALGGFILSGILLYLVWQMPIKKYIKWLLFIPISAFGVLIGLSRIYLHVHYATDVMGSLFATFVCFSISRVISQIRYPVFHHLDNKDRVSSEQPADLF